MELQQTMYEWTSMQKSEKYAIFVYDPVNEAPCDRYITLLFFACSVAFFPVPEIEKQKVA